MLEQVSNSVKFLAFYTASKQGKTGLTVTVDIYNPSGSQIVTAGSATAIGGGLYSYTLSTNNSAEGEYAAVFKTTDSTVDSQHIPSLWVLGRAGVENLDAATSSRLASSAYTAPTAAPTVTAIRQEMDSNSTKLSNLDAAVSTRSTLTAAQVNAEVDTALSDVGLTTTITGRIDQAISSRLASASYTAPANSDVSAIKAKTDLLETTRLAQCSTVATTGAQLAAALS